MQDISVFEGKPNAFGEPVQNAIAAERVLESSPPKESHEPRGQFGRGFMTPFVFFDEVQDSPSDPEQDALGQVRPWERNTQTSVEPPATPTAEGQLYDTIQFNLNVHE